MMGGHGLCCCTHSSLTTDTERYGDDVQKSKIRSWDATIAKGDRQTLGMEIAPEDTVLLVKRVHDEGATNDFNALNPKKVVQAGDFLVAVNGISGDAAQMLDEVKVRTSTDREASEVRFSVLRTQSFYATVNKIGPLGLKFTLMKKNMVVKEVNAGPIQKWNDDNPSSKIMPGDMFLEVDGHEAVKSNSLGNGVMYDLGPLIDALKSDGEHRILVRPLGGMASAQIH
mmetsp:Transcript_95254/g.188764  ORF Transcript_95254/g.188764 Transcript_95254/m.188764 type:complete len:227 (+) Transcript_95254:81-761(+)|eukprot:CAMPEP_0172802192 /NCGR_PEP_ID=MMETSP1075-20121228/3747_1 /TAXON_ID=2916 /ORGANISM="Ceratium fusus, Strain PA161109" /LENGTH=226 /DNA_ID=CAMNT_0013640435 /DNA_START=80 /DNA_END=760 /DNA_ORIENTATION=+